MGLVPKTFQILLMLCLIFATQQLKKDEEYRLPQNLKPLRYSLLLDIDPSENSFSGSVDITLSGTSADNNTIQLHASPDYITITSAELDFLPQLQCSVTDTNKLTEIVTLTCPEDSLTGQNIILIQFDGKYAEDMRGLYKSTYVEDGIENIIVTAQFEPTYSRRVYPCFDEPEIKAEYSVFLRHPTDYSGLSITQSTENLTITGTNKTQTLFATTPNIPTYQLSILVSNFVANLEEPAENNFNVYTRSSARNFTTVATKYGPDLIDILGTWTGINYTEIDERVAFVAAIPDVPNGARDSWGLITLRETDILDEDAKTSVIIEQDIIRALTHQFAHQWFGDFVSLTWWSDAWISGGFATYFEYFIPDQISESTFEFESQFLVDVLQPILQRDALVSSVPLSNNESEIVTPADDRIKLNDVALKKGGSVVRMLRNIIGEDDFQVGINAFLSTHERENVTAHTLLETLHSSTDYYLNYAIFMEAWIYSSGFPLLTATLNEEKTIINLSQERFILNPNNNTNNTTKTEWFVPISYTTSEEKNFTIDVKGWLEPDLTYTVDISEDSWVIFNVQQIGFYRVNYDDTLWDRIITALNNNDERTDIHALNRAQLIDDIFNIARIGKVDYEKVFDLGDFLSDETEYYPWASALNAVSYLTGKLGDSDAEELLKNQTIRWLNDAFPNATAEVSTDIEKIKEVLILNWACKLEIESCLSYTTDTFEDFKSSKSLPDYNKRGLVFCFGLKSSTDASADYSFLFKLFKNSSSPVEQKAILSTLGCVLDETILSNYLKETIADDSSIRKQDAITAFESVYSNSEVGLTTFLTFLERYVDDIADRFIGLNTLPQVLTGVAEKLYTEDQLTRFTKIVDSITDEEIQAIGKEAIDIVAVNVEFTKTYGSKIKDVLEKRAHGNSSIVKPMYILSVLLSIFVIYFI